MKYYVSNSCISYTFLSTKQLYKPVQVMPDLHIGQHTGHHVIVKVMPLLYFIKLQVRYELMKFMTCLFQPHCHTKKLKYCLDIHIVNVIFSVNASNCVKWLQNFACVCGGKICYEMHESILMKRFTQAT